MPVYAGPWWRDGEEHAGFVRVDRGRVVEEGARTPSNARPAVLLDGLHNYHTHVGDAFLLGRHLPRTLDALVRPGTGYKHRMLARASKSVIVSGVRRMLRRYAEAGTASVLDFREQGVAGIRWVQSVHRALEPEGPVVRLLGRPTRLPVARDELDDLLELADGLGVSSLSDVGEEAWHAIAEACHRARKPLAVHVSERRREDVGTVLGGRPALLVHLTKANRHDLREVRDAGVPVALCPSSNAFFRLRCPVAALHAAQIPFHFGTDNAMLGSIHVVHEAVRAKRLAPAIPDGALLRALTRSPEKALNHVRPVRSLAGSRGRLVLLPLRRGRVAWGRRPLVVRR